MPALVAEAVQAPSFTKKSPISAAQARCLDMQAKQHEAEMEFLEIKKNMKIEKHKRKMEVLDAEFEYWNEMKKNIKSPENAKPRPKNRSRK